jgi:hypothetical protein
MPIPHTPPDFDLERPIFDQKAENFVHFKVELFRAFLVKS